MALLLALTGPGVAATENLELALPSGPVPALLDTAVPEPRRGVVMLLPDGRDPRAAELAADLAAGLARHGWDVLRVGGPLVMPEVAYGPRDDLVAGMESLVTAVRERLKDEQGRPTPFVVGHGWGAILAALYLEGREEPRVAGLAALNAASPPRLEALQLAALLPGIKVPLLDVYAERGWARVAAGATARREAALAKTEGAYHQLALATADHWFSGQRGYLVKRVRGWLERHGEEGQ